MSTTPSTIEMWEGKQQLRGGVSFPRELRGPLTSDHRWSSVWTPPQFLSILLCVGSPCSLLRAWAGSTPGQPHYELNKPSLACAWISEPCLFTRPAPLGPGAWNTRHPTEWRV